MKSTLPEGDRRAQEGEGARYYIDALRTTILNLRVEVARKNARLAHVPDVSAVVALCTRYRTSLSNASAIGARDVAIMVMQDVLQVVLKALTGIRESSGRAVPVSAACEGEFCSVCGGPAAGKLGEEILFDDPHPNRHPLTAYVCRDHFDTVLNNRKAPGQSGD